MADVFIFGENHSQWEEIKLTQKMIINLKPDYLLHELIYEDLSLNKSTHSKRLNSCKVGGLCDPGLNKHIYEMALENDIPLVGIDLERVDSKHIKESFHIREKHMVSMIKKYMNKPGVKVIAVVVGDTHLRSTATEKLGSKSLILKEFEKHPDVRIIRSRFKEIS